ncbi:hypothetical protein HYFRA_00012323 [Hymenoscyphus fraxineus]|uniref:F-box domain-containing protein n=1 Tax=Hymenoscyphus fraxineus TaxID=746836 RepID=A0A9N9L250_9HELO|nr:hypothetical protein HYFRA_00012323 [Hymenoscyphus fraxineus]
MVNQDFQNRRAPGYVMRPRPARKTKSQRRSMSKKSVPKPFRFLDLPPEIRRIVYIFFIKSPAELKIIRRTEPSIIPTFFKAFLLTCAQTYHELREILFNTSKFLFVVPSSIGYYGFPHEYYLGPGCLQTRLQIQSLRVHLRHREPKNHRFSGAKPRRALCPVLEEMLLHGDLHQLDISFDRPVVGVEAIESWRAVWRACEKPKVVNGVLRYVKVNVHHRT